MAMMLRAIITLSIILGFGIGSQAYAQSPAKIKNKKSKKILNISFEKNEKRRRPSALDRAVKSSAKKKIVGMNYDPKNPEDIQFDPIKKPKKFRKRAKVTSMPEKAPVPQDPSAKNPIVVGSNVIILPKKTDAEILQSYQRAANVVLDSDYAEDSL